MELFVFICASAMVLGGALGVVLRSNPVHAALSLVLTLFGIAVMFVSQHAEFLAAVQVVVYAGAIVVLFLFVIMLLGVDRAENLETEPLGIQRPLAIVLGFGFVALLVTTILQGRDSLNMRGDGINVASDGDHDANIRQIARSIFSNYVVAFEVTSVLLIVAVVGTVVLARKRKSDKDLTGVTA
ncbi:MAG: NADH-quinone oxidoreductase subunit J [Actinomycetes bacterium]|jgi:NADH-quinone oxidoreductase subunit J